MCIVYRDAASAWYGMYALTIKHTYNVKLHRRVYWQTVEYAVDTGNYRIIINCKSKSKITGCKVFQSRNSTSILLNVYIGLKFGRFSLGLLVVVFVGVCVCVKLHFAHFVGVLCI